MHRIKKYTYIYTYHSCQLCTTFKLDDTIDIKIQFPYYLIIDSYGKCFLFTNNCLESPEKFGRVGMYDTRV